MMILFLLCITVVFGLRLVNIQIVNADKYLERAPSLYTRTQRITAARGEIFDRNGVPLAVNKIGYNLTINKAYLDTSSENEMILRLISLFRQSGEDWNDSLPISDSAPFEFLPDREKDISKLKKYLGVEQYTSVEDVIYWLRDLYDLEDFSDRDFRDVAGVRYEMALRDFSMKTPYTFATDISMDTVTKISENSLFLPGAVVEETTVREYVAGDVAPHIVGIIGPIYADDLENLSEDYSLDDYIGKLGIEKAYENELRGTPGETTIYLDSKGNVLNVEETVSPTPGNSVYLTIDVNHQRALQQALATQIAFLQSQEDADHGKDVTGGCAVVTDVKSGEVLAIANYPTFDLSTYYSDYATLITDPNSPYYNRALRGIYAPGSTYKPSVATAALSEKIISASTTINCTGRYTYFPVYQPTCMSVHRNINVINALRVSCNIFFYDIGRQLGIDRINSYSALFGLGQPTGIELPESAGRLAGPEYRKAQNLDWYSGDVLQAAIGQSDNAFTPIQLVNYAATLANDGKRMDLNIVKKISSYNGEQTVYEATPSVVVDFSDYGVDRSVFETVREGMVLATAGTAGAALKNYSIPIASKTGTPETGVSLNAVFICYAPADDPQIAICIVLENAGHGYNASQLARYFLDYYFYGIEIPTAEEVLSGK